MRNQNTAYLPCQPSYFRNAFNYLTGSSDRNGQSNDGAYQHQDYSNLCQDNERENQSGYGNTFSQIGKFGKADYRTNIKWCNPYWGCGCLLSASLIISRYNRQQDDYMCISLYQSNLNRNLLSFEYIPFLFQWNDRYGTVRFQHFTEISNLYIQR